MLKARWLQRVSAALLTAALVSSAELRPARAWTQSGHMSIASFAYDALPEQTRARLVALLRKHPRFEQDFAPHLPTASTPAEQARWIFAWAAVWPDLARGQPAFERGHWHYINLPLTLQQHGLVSCAEARRNLPESQRRVAAEQARRAARKAEPAAPAGAAPASAASEPASAAPARAAPEPAGAAAERALTPSDINDIRAAFQWAQRTLGDLQRSEPERALALSWLLHLVGDAHQPLHTVALFSPRRFELGDRGGNEIVAGGARSLHHLWDALLGADDSLPAIRAQAVRWRSTPEQRHLAQAARRSLDLDGWLDEGCALARERVYSPTVLAAARTAESGPLDSKPEATLEPGYLTRARQAAERRAIQAGARLAALLR